MEIFVTGGTGNIGQHVTLALLERGHHVRLLTRTPDRIPAFGQMDNLTLIKGNMMQLDVVENALKGCDAVIHIALGWGNDPVEMLMNDTRITAFLLNAAEEARVKNFIYTSSTAAMGDMYHGINEGSLRVPTDLYGATKAATEMFLLGFRKFYQKQGGYGLPVKMRRNIIRPGYTFSSPAVPGGASQSDTRFQNIASAIVRGEDLTFSRNDGTQFLSSRQIAQLYVRLVESDLNEEIFFALGSRFISWYDIACMARDMTPGCTSRIIASDEEGPHALYCVDKMDKVFGLRFDGGDDLAEHIQWNLARAKAALAGETLHDPVHSWSGLEDEQ